MACYLEPLETWRAAVYAYEPHLVLFNHLTVSHLADFSQELKEWNVLVGCLMNEGLLYFPGERTFCSKRQDEHMHCDLYLSWNDVHRAELIEHSFCTPPEMAHTIGCPRFDFYREPWCRVYEQPRHEDGFPVIFLRKACQKEFGILGSEVKSISSDEQRVSLGSFPHRTQPEMAVF